MDRDRMSEILNNKELKKLIKAFSKKPLEIKIGILGNSTRSDSNSNAAIGAKHEYGLAGMPVRSFLRQPLIDELQRFLNKSNLFDKKALATIIDNSSLIEWMKLIGLVAEDCISEGFNTGGFGKWKRSNMEFKKNHQTLVETQQLRNSIISKVE
jgi:hypothetical protein